MGLYTRGYTQKFYNAFLYTKGCPWVTRGQKQKIFKKFSFCICSQKWGGGVVHEAVQYSISFYAMFFYNLFSEYTASFFTCDTNRHYPASMRCNGRFDCLDRTDEILCSTVMLRVQHQKFTKLLIRE